MSVEELFSELRKLKRADTLRAMQLLVWDLAVEEEALLLPGAPYEVWSPFDASGAAETLTNMLKADSEVRDA